MYLNIISSSDIYIKCGWVLEKVTVSMYGKKSKQINMDKLILSVEG